MYFLHIGNSKLRLCWWFQYSTSVSMCGYWWSNIFVAYLQHQMYLLIYVCVMCWMYVCKRSELLFVHVDFTRNWIIVNKRNVNRSLHWMSSEYDGQVQGLLPHQSLNHPSISTIFSSLFDRFYWIWSIQGYKCLFARMFVSIFSLCLELEQNFLFLLVFLWHSFRLYL